MTQLNIFEKKKQLKMKYYIIVFQQVRILMD